MAADYRGIIDDPSVPIEQLRQRIAYLEKRLRDPTVNLPGAPHKYAAYTGIEVTLPNSGAYQAGTVPITFSITAGSAAEYWLFMANAIVRADSANDATFRSRIRETVGNVEVGAAHTERAYWGAATNLQGYYTVSPQGRYQVPAGATRTFIVESAAQSAIGGFGFAGGGVANNLMAIRVV